MTARLIKRMGGMLDAEVGEGSFKGFRSKSFPTHLSARIGNFLQR
jgi:hypothetical protein